MNRKISVCITNWCSQHILVKEEMIPVIQYGIEVSLNSSIKIILLLLIGTIFGKLLETIVVLFVFGIVRKFAGGVHCKTDIGCFLGMFLICLISIAVSQNSENINLLFLMTGLIVAWFNVWKFAPCNSKVNPITDIDILEQKRKGTILVITGLSILIILLPEKDLKWLIFCPVFIEALTILPILERRGVT